MSPDPQARMPNLPQATVVMYYVQSVPLQTSVAWLLLHDGDRKPGSLEYAHQNAGPGQLQKTPAASCCLLQWSTRTTVTATLKFACPSGYEESDGTSREVPSYAPPSSLHPSSLTKRSTEKRGTATHAERDPGVQSGVACMVVCCRRWDGTNGGPGRSFAEPSSYYYARNAAGWRARRRFWRGLVYCQFSISFFPFSFTLTRIDQRAAPCSDSCILHLMTTAACSICKTACLCACSLGANLSLSLRPPNHTRMQLSCSALQRGGR